MRQDSVEAKVLCGKVTKYGLWSEVEPRDGGVLFGGEEDDEYRSLLDCALPTGMYVA